VPAAPNADPNGNRNPADRDPDTHLHQDSAPDADFDPDATADRDADILTGSA
jgi:hypothetical protein